MVVVFVFVCGGVIGGGLGAGCVGRRSAGGGGGLVV